MHLQIGDHLSTVYNDQLFYLNRQDIGLTLFTGFKIWLVHNCQIKEDHLNINIFTALLCYNACTLLNMVETSVANNNKLKIQPRGMATFRKILQFNVFWGFKLLVSFNFHFLKWYLPIKVFYRCHRGASKEFGIPLDNYWIKIYFLSSLEQRVRLFAFICKWLNTQSNYANHS